MPKSPPDRPATVKLHGQKIGDADEHLIPGKDTTMMDGYGMMEHMEMMGPWMWITMSLLWGFIIVGLICMIRWFLLPFRRDDSEKYGPLRASGPEYRNAPHNNKRMRGEQ